MNNLTRKFVLSNGSTLIQGVGGFWFLQEGPARPIQISAWEAANMLADLVEAATKLHEEHQL
jgi:hypothetical protein